MDSNSLAVTLIPSTQRYSEDDDRWLQQVADLHQQLRSETGAGVPAQASAPGMKGSIDELILALGSAGAFTTTVEMLRVWLSRDRTRSVKAGWTGRDGIRQEVTLSADGADSATLAPLVEALAHKIEASS
jgi:hypothetical protein